MHSNIFSAADWDLKRKFYTYCMEMVNMLLTVVWNQFSNHYVSIIVNRVGHYD